MRKWFAVALLTMTMATVFLIGCTDESGTNLSTSSALTGSVTDYFPMDAGYSTTYEVTRSDGLIEQVTFIIGDPVTINGTPAVEWRVYNNGNVTTSYLQATNDAIYYWDTDRSTRETILRLPLTLGSSWSRFATTETTRGTGGGPYTDIITDPWNKYDLDTTTVINNGTLGKNFPTLGSEIMTVQGIENLNLETSGGFTDAIHITTTSSMGRTNHYWFAESVGLVKYIIGATDASYPNGEKTGRIVQYGK